VTRGLILAAPASGSGKTVVTLALLRHLRDAGTAVSSLKIGPDYIDPAFHAAASGRCCRNFDPWTMRAQTLAAVRRGAAEGADIVLTEGVMGLFDGAADGTGSTAEAARLTGWPVVLVVDVSGMGASVAALLRGFRDHDPALDLAGVIFNRIGSARHLAMLEEAVAPLGIAIIGGLPAESALALPDRHLGLVQAGEHPDLERFLDEASAFVGRWLDCTSLAGLAKAGNDSAGAASANGVDGAAGLRPLGQRMAVARDRAFLFAYPHLLDAWRKAGAEIVPFSPLADETPDDGADAVFLPGGYPELHAGRLAAGHRFLAGLRAAAARGCVVYGECGGYMVLGEGLVDGAGRRHAMAGLLPLETSFAEPRRSLGYRSLELVADCPLGCGGEEFRGHEFHYASIVGAEGGEPLFAARDALGASQPARGARRGPVMGSFVHLVDRAGGQGAQGRPLAL
jgi:cobyrinic acid a,c-diamide synthase